MQSHSQGQNLVQLGLVLLLLGLPAALVFLGRLDQTAGRLDHRDACLNGIFLISLGLTWSRLKLSQAWRDIVFRLALYGTLTKWITSLVLVCWVAEGSLFSATPGQLSLLVQDSWLNLSWLFLVIASIVGFLLIGSRSPRH